MESVTENQLRPLTPLTALAGQSDTGHVAATAKAKSPGADRKTARSVRTYSSKVAEIIAKRLEGRVVDHDDPSQSLGSPEELAERMLSVVPPGGSPWFKIVGPAYTGSGLARVLGVSRQRVSERARERQLWALRTADRQTVYPAAQFHTDFSVLPGLMDVLTCFDEADVDDWTLASWVMAAHPELDDVSIIDWLRRHPEDVEVPLRLARRTARRWGR